MKDFLNKLFPRIDQIILRVSLLLCFFAINIIYTFGTPYAIQYLGIEHGLSHNSVTTIYQDNNRLMWFGTYDGLNRYDGYEFKVFRNIIGDSTSLSSNSINAIEGDKYNNLWIAGLKGVSIYNPIRSNFTPLKYIPFTSRSPQSINDDVHVLKAAAENMLVGTRQFGLIVFEKESKTGIQIPLVVGGRKHGNYNVSGLDYDSLNRVVWVFIQNEGLYKYDLGRRSLALVNNTFKLANSLKSDSRGGLYVGDDHNLFLYNIPTNTFSAGLISENTTVVSLCRDRNNVLWIATDGDGLWFLPNSAKAASRFVSSRGLSINSNAVFSAYEDYEGRKWVGTLRGGVNMIDPKVSPFKTITFNSAPNSRVENFILSFAEDERNNIWIGTDGAGLKYWDRRNNKFSEFKHTTNPNSLSSNFVTNIERDFNNDIWISTWFGGVNRFNKASNTFQRYQCYNPTTNAIENNVWLVFEDSRKRLWVSTTNNGTLYLFNRAENKFEVFDPSIVNIQSLKEDGEGNLWAGNYSSLIKLDLINRKHKTYNIGYPVRAIHKDKRHNFWIGTQEGGLVEFNRNTGKTLQYTTANGLPSNTILQILEDRKGNMWMSTFNGLVRFDPVNKSSRNFSESDGLQSSQFMFNAGLALTSGEFLFGGIKGFNIFYPDSVRDHNSKPNIFLSGLKINNVPIDQDISYITDYTSDRIKAIEVPYDKAVVSLEFVAIEYTSPDKIKYAYYLDGWDKGWNYVNNIRAANYTRLSEGSYVFKIKVSNPYGVWNNETRLLKITILPPWYRTWWAYIFYASIVAGVIYFYTLYRARQTRLEYEVKIAHLNAEKEREINEKKLSFFTDVSHEFRTPLTLIINPIKDLLQNGEKNEENKELNIVYRNARRLLSLVDQLLLFRKADTNSDVLKISRTNFSHLCNDVHLSFVQQAKAKKMSYKFECSNDNVELYVDREKIEIALFNLLSNAFKYTPAGGTVIFRVTESEEEVEVAVEDDGPGIPKEVGNKLFNKYYRIQSQGRSSNMGFGIGLFLVRYFIESHKGEVTYESEEGKGTTFIMKLKKGAAHLATEEIHEDSGEDSVMLQELVEEPVSKEEKSQLDVLVSEKKSLLIVDDDPQLREYLADIFKKDFVIFEAESGEEGLKQAQQNIPDVVITDISMQEMSGIDLCKKIKETPATSHIPVILLTGTSSRDTQLQGVEGGADDFITKPFEKDLLVAKVFAIIKNRNVLQNYFYNEITLQKNTLKVSSEYKEFLNTCIRIVEDHLEDEQFTIQTMASEIGMSHSTLYKKVKSISGQSVNGFIRFIRLRKAAELFITTNANVNEVAFRVGIKDIKYFRSQFNKLFGMNPSEYVKKFRKPFNNSFTLSEKAIRLKEK